MTDSHLSGFNWSVADLLRGDYKQFEYRKVIHRNPCGSSTLRNNARSATA
jgi:hypothetical protein